MATLGLLIDNIGVLCGTPVIQIIEINDSDDVDIYLGNGWHYSPSP